MLPLLLAGGKLVGGLGLTGAGAVGLSQAALQIPGARELLGLTQEDIARGETYDLNNPDKYRDDIGDYARSLFSGVSTDQVREAAKNQAITDLNKSFRPAYARVKSGYEALGLQAPDISEFEYNKGTGENTAALSFRSEDRLKQLEALQNANAAGVDISGLGSASVSTIGRAIEDQRKADLEAERLKLKAEAEDVLNKANLRADGIRQEERADLLGQQIRSQEVNMLQLNNQNAAALRSSQLNNRRLDLQEKRQDVEDRRTSRRDQQLALMTIMKGLAEMGSSITA